MNKYLLTIEFRYHDAPKNESDYTYKSKTVTIGVYDDFDSACNSGNRLMEKLESKFDLHVFPNGKGTARRERFSKNGGAFGSKKDLITNLAYLKTPFDFYAKIETLDYSDIAVELTECVEASKRYMRYRADID